jgi:O-antigen ligase
MTPRRSATHWRGDPEALGFSGAHSPGVSLDPSALPAAALVIAVSAAMAAFAGLATAVIGGMAGYRAVYYVAVFSVLVVGGLVTLTRREPLRFAFLALIVCFPIAAAALPPGRFGIDVFHAVMLLLAIGLIGKQLTGSSGTAGSFFPTRSLLLACLLILPCIAFSQYPLWSLREFIVKNFTIYVFLLFALSELKRERGFERLVLLLSVVLLFMAAGLYIDQFLHLNLSLRGSNLNQSTISESGLAIYRAAGFFQDPQRAGAYLACMITFLLLLSARGRFDGMKLRFLVWIAIAASLGALMTTISRSAMLACLSVSAITLFLFNKWSTSVKLLVLGSAIAVAMSLAFVPVETWLNTLPAAVLERFQYVGEETEDRLMIWFDTWDMFADHPVTGIGIASFQRYLIETRPGVFNYYDIGTAAGVAYIPDQPESGYLKILYEGGILGALAALTIVADAFRRAIAVIADQRLEAHARTEMIASLAALATFGTTFVTLYTASDERMAALCAVFLAVILHRSLQAGRLAQEA